MIGSRLVIHVVRGRSARHEKAATRRQVYNRLGVAIQLLAASHEAGHTCPVTTGIALRVVAERAYRRMQEGADSVTPFYRAIDPDSALAGKLACGREFIRRMRSAETAEQPNAADSR